MESLGRGFDFTRAMRHLCEDIVVRSPDLSHVDLRRVAISMCRTRHTGSHGTYASLTPLRFESGATQKKLRGRKYGVERVWDESGEEFLYILSFYVPRFLNTSLEEKLSTVFHELWHISQEFDGDLRRFEGRYYAHGSSQRDYDAKMNKLAQRWLSLGPPEHLYDFLAPSFDELAEEYGKVVGTHWPTPRLIPL